MDVYEIRRENLRELMRQWGGPTSLATKLGHTNGSYIAQLAGPNPSREISEKVARGVEKSLGLSAGWMDKVHERRQSEALDDQLLSKVIRAVSAALDEATLRPAPNKFAELVSLTYENARGTGRVEEIFVQRLVRLMK